MREAVDTRYKPSIWRMLAQMCSSNRNSREIRQSARSSSLQTLLLWQPIKKPILPAVNNDAALWGASARRHFGK